MRRWLGIVVGLFIAAIFMLVVALLFTGPENRRAMFNDRAPAADPGSHPPPPVTEPASR